MVLGVIIQSSHDAEGIVLAGTEEVACKKCLGEKYVEWGYLKVITED